MQHYLFTSARRFGKYIHAASEIVSAAGYLKVDSESGYFMYRPRPDGDTVSYEESDRT